MNDMKQFLQRLMHNRQEDTFTDESLMRKVQALYTIYAGTMPPEQLILHAGRYNALSYIHQDDPRLRLLGLARLILEKGNLKPPTDEDIPRLMNELENRLADILARRAVEEHLEQKISERLEEKQEEYVEEVRREILREEAEDAETPQSRRKLEELEAKDRIGLAQTVMTVVRPKHLREIVGQEAAIQSLAAKMSSPYPQHIILYGPPGVGKTTAARLVLDEAKYLPYTAFQKDAPFIECDGTTLRWDSRDITNPLIGSVHDPIYQGAQRDFADDGVPEPKPGLVTDAHGGVLFLDEIGELDPIMLNKLLKVLEDKRVHFESAYYDESNPAVPAYIKKLFRDGAPADFILIGATTRDPSEINPAIRSRCAEVFFEPLQPEDVERIVLQASNKLGVTPEKSAVTLISECTTEGRKAVNLLADAYGLAVYEAGTRRNIKITAEIVRRTVQVSRLTPQKRKVASPSGKVGHIYGLGVSGYWGSLIEIEAAAYEAAEKGKGSLHFNSTAGTMAKDSVSTAASVVRAMTDRNLSDYDLHVNIVGGGNIDGPSAGAAITAAILSAVEKVPLRQDVAITGEISLAGDIKPVGGLHEKAFAAKQGGMTTLLIPEENRRDLEAAHLGMNVISVRHMQDAWTNLVFNERKEIL